MTIPDAAPVDREHDDRGSRRDRPAPTTRSWSSSRTRPAGTSRRRPTASSLASIAPFERWTGHARRRRCSAPPSSTSSRPSGQLFYETRYATVLSLSGEVREVALSVRCADGGELPILVNAVVVTGRRRPAPRHPHRRLRRDGAPGLRAAAAARAARRRGVRGARARAPGRVERVRRRRPPRTSSPRPSSRAPRTALRASSAAVLLADDSAPLELVAGDDTTLALFPAGPRGPRGAGDRQWRDRHRRQPRPGRRDHARPR